MRHTQPLSSDEQLVDVAIRKRGGSHSEQDRALTLYRMAQRRGDVTRYVHLERVADLVLGEGAHV